jgi:phenylacetate-CoA ligase
MVTSEMLFEEDKKLCKKQLGIPIINEYGASELDLISLFRTQKENGKSMLKLCLLKF